MSRFNSKIIDQDIEEVVNATLPWENLRNKTVLITGANGFLPAYMLFTLLRLNDDGYNIKILALIRNQQKAEKKFKGILIHGLEYINQDVTAPLKYSGKIDFIIHAASQASPKYYGKDPVGTLAANTIGTFNLLESAHKNQVDKFLFFSSSEVYGSVEAEYIPTPEHVFGHVDPTNIRSCYAESKRMGETMCVSWMHQFSVPVNMVRPFHTYGPGMELTDGRVYADFVSDIIGRRDIIMKSEGTATRAFCYLSDATKGFFTVLLTGVSGEAYNIGNPDEEISVVDLAEKLVTLFPERKLNVRRAAPSGPYIKSTVNRNVPDISKIKSLGWNPVTTIESGFMRTIQSYELNGN